MKASKLVLCEVRVQYQQITTHNVVEIEQKHVEEKLITTKIVVVEKCVFLGKILNLSHKIIRTTKL